MTVSFGLVDFNTGSQILDLPVLEGASWAAMLNKPDSLSCTVDLRDADVQALDIESSAAPKKTVLFASTEFGEVLAWGVISSQDWDDDARTCTIDATGGGQYFKQRIIAPPSAATGQIVNPDGSLSTAFDTTLTDLTLGSVGVELVRQALSWPGAPTSFVLPEPVADPGQTITYKLVDYKRVLAALDDLTAREGGPDFAFDARRDSTGLALEFVMRAGSPYLGIDVGSWTVGGPSSPISKLKLKSDGGDIATHVWMQAGRTDSKVIVAREVNEELLDLVGYPVLDLVDTTHTNVTEQSTLDQYARENKARAAGVTRQPSFSVRGDAMPRLGQYRPGDFVALDMPANRAPFREGPLPIRILGISGDETGKEVKITCDLVKA